MWHYFTFHDPYIVVNIVYICLISVNVILFNFSSGRRHHPPEIAAQYVQKGVEGAFGGSWGFTHRRPEGGTKDVLLPPNAFEEPTHVQLLTSSLCSQTGGVNMLSLIVSTV